LPPTPQTPNPQTPIPNPHVYFIKIIMNIKIKKNKIKLNK